MPQSSHGTGLTEVLVGDVRRIFLAAHHISWELYTSYPCVIQHRTKFHFLRFP